MSLDYVLLWALVIGNGLATLLVIRQVAMLPKFSRPPGPRPGSQLDWALATLDGTVRESSAMPAEYVMLFASERCNACHALFASIARFGRPEAHLVVAAESDGVMLEAAARTDRARLYDEFLLGADVAFMQRHGIPTTPYAVAVRLGRVVSAGPARTPTELAQIADILRSGGALKTAKV